MILFVRFLLICIAGYCFTSWAVLFYHFNKDRFADDQLEQASNTAFQFGLCAILALGFYGLILK